jgi:hypothetical protein
MLEDRKTDPKNRKVTGVYFEVAQKAILHPTRLKFRSY